MSLKNQNNYFHLQFYSFYINLCNFQIISCILSTVGLIFLNGKAHFYPLKDIVGPSLCYFYVHTELWFGMYKQYASLFITFYRYICIFFGTKLFQLNISPKVKVEIKIFYTGYSLRAQKTDELKITFRDLHKSLLFARPCFHVTCQCQC